MSILTVIAGISRDINDICTNSYCTGKFNRTASYFKLVAKEIAIRRGLIQASRPERVDGRMVDYLDYAILLSLWREIYVKTPYYFEADSDRPTVLDAGSNIGLSILYFKQLYPNANITAFEPDQQTFGVLKSNVEANRLSDVRLVNKAVGDHQGVIEWHFDGSHPGSLSMSAVSREFLPDTTKVECVVLSDYIEGPVDFAKIDVEGSEGRVLEDMRTSGKIRLVRQMAIEFHPWCNVPLPTIVSGLEKEGFAVRAEPSDPFHPSMIFAARL